MADAHDIPGGREPAAGSGDSGARIVRWSEDAGGLSPEECARRGVEAAAGLVISGDIFGTNNYPDAHFCACAEIYHAVTGAGDNFDDHVAVIFRVAEIRGGAYPVVGQESVRMIMQPLSDGSVSARWNEVDHGSLVRPPEDAGLAPESLDARSAVGPPLSLGPMPEQDTDSGHPPSFLFLKDPGAGWQIWRRFLGPAGGESGGKSEPREETYSMVYPMSSPEMNWRFRVYDTPGGGVRWEVDSGARR